MRGEAGGFFGVGTEKENAGFSDFSRGAFGEFGVGIQAGAYGSATNGEVVESVQCLSDSVEVAVEQTDPAGKFLFNGERSCVLQMGAADFDDGTEFLGLCVESVAKLFYGGNQAARGFGGGGDVHGGGKSVVRGLRHVDVVVGMDGFLAAHHAAGN